MYWWEDMVLNEQQADSPPIDTRDGKDEVAEVTAPDELTLKLTFKNPAPATVERIAAWVNGIDIGPRWMVPKHYMKQFHPKYNKSINAKSGDWTTKHDQKLHWNMNPDYPTMVGSGTSSPRRGRRTIWERNPYYYVVSKDGDQLPYLDTCAVDGARSTRRCRSSRSPPASSDYVHGPHSSLTLADFSAASRQAEAEGKIQVYTWDSGSGTGSITFFNHEHPDKKLRDLIGKKEFRVALSHAYNRPEAKKTIYFETGRADLGNPEPQGLELPGQRRGEEDLRAVARRLARVRPGEGEIDARRARPEGPTATGSGSTRTAEADPDRLDYQADTTKETRRQGHPAASRTGTRSGIKTKLNPTAPTTFGDRWGRGTVEQPNAWEVGDSARSSTPVGSSRWRPCTGHRCPGRATPAHRRSDRGRRSRRTVSPWKRQPPFTIVEDSFPLEQDLAKLQDT